MKYLFYLNLGHDNHGRKITDYIAANDDWWENTHDFIQWAFPTSQQSMYNRNAPLLDWKLRLFLRNPISRHYHKLLLNRANTFYDFAYPDWVNRIYGHNLLRISRIMHFCKSCNHEFPEYDAFMYLALVALRIGLLPVRTYDYWNDIL